MESRGTQGRPVSRCSACAQLCHPSPCCSVHQGRLIPMNCDSGAPCALASSPGGVADPCSRGPACVAVLPCPCPHLFLPLGRRDQTGSCWLHCASVPSLLSTPPSTFPSFCLLSIPVECAEGRLHVGGGNSGTGGGLRGGGVGWGAAVPFPPSSRCYQTCVSAFCSEKALVSPAQQSHSKGIPPSFIVMMIWGW